HAPHRFTQGGVEFAVIAAPGAEGEDNLLVWLPKQRALFSGDFFGPLFPMLPNLFTLRGEKFRHPIDYLASLDQVIALAPDIILPSHFDPRTEDLQRDLLLMRNATAYVHDQTVAGMNAGKSLWQLMREVQLPPDLAISEGHGKVSWNVRSIWEYYSTWFRFESTTELYPVPVHSLYSELAALAGGADGLTSLAQEKLDAAQSVGSDAGNKASNSASNKESNIVQALHLVEIALSANADYQPALALRLAALQALLQQAENTSGNYSEIGWLNSRIAATRKQLDDHAP
ncbi:MAG: alkyl sulfatase dimerization domain-containing protein, partial [Pseudomonadales bacterium]